MADGRRTIGKRSARIIFAKVQKRDELDKETAFYLWMTYKQREGEFLYL